MRTTIKTYVFSLCVLICAAAANAQQQPQTPTADPAFAEFQERVKAYSRMRAELAGKVPALPDQATKEQIEAHKTALQQAVMAAREGADPGDIITSGTADAIRSLIRNAYTGEERRKLRQSLFVAENKTVPVRANSPYPEAAEILEMPPALLLALPQLPKELRWRFVGNNLLLMDSDLLLIADYMKKALPKN